MAEDDRIKYSDIIQPDDSIEKLVKQLGELNQSYETMVNAIRAGADRITHAIKGASGATEDGRRSIESATAATSRLERAQKELKIAMSDTGKQIAWLKAQTADQNKASVEQQRYIQQAITSYDRLKSDLKQTIALYKSLTEAEREDSTMGGVLLQSIINIRTQIKALDAQMKPHIQTITEVQKAEQKLAFLQSAEGQRLLDLKAKIAEVKNERKQEHAITHSLIEAHEKLAFANSKENEQLKLYSMLINETNRIAKLNAQVSRSQEGSYNRLAAQYELNKIKLNAMSQAERETTESGKKLVAETNEMYQQMIKLQEATGNYRLSVGHYQKTWDGLGFSIMQVVRELPAAAVSLNTFFLGISNNIPLVMDEIQRLREKNKQLADSGEETINVTKEIVKSFFSWNTVLVVLLTAFSMFGSQILEFILSVVKGKEAVISLEEQLDNVAEELESTNAGFGNNIVSLKKLQSEWKGLKTIAEKNQWIRDNESEFKKLGIAVDSVTDAENVFVENTEAVITALKLRAKAAAAQKLAAEQYEKALIKRNEAETEQAKGPSFSDKLKNFFVQASLRSSELPANLDVADRLSSEVYHKERIKDLNEEADAAEKTGDAYFDLVDGYEAAAKAALKTAGIGAPHKDPKKTRKGREPRDLTDTINKNDIKLEREYQESITKLQNDEFAKRRKAAADRVQDENNKLREMYRKNEEYVANVEGKYKELTDDQKKQIEQQQKWITDTIANNLELLKNQLEKIQKEQAINSAKIEREAINAVSFSTMGTVTPSVSATVTINDDALEKSLEKERNLRIESAEIEYKLTVDTNKRLLALGDKNARDERELEIQHLKDIEKIYAEYDAIILDRRRQTIEDRLELVKKGTEEELVLLLEQNEIARQIAQSENLAKPAEQQVDTAIIDAKFGKSAKLIRGTFDMEQFEATQELASAIFNEEERTQEEITRFRLEQEKARWEKQIALAEAGGLEWSKAQINIAKSTVAGIDRQLKDMDNPIKKIAEKGPVGGLLASLGFDDKQIAALDQAKEVVLNNISQIMEADTQAAEQAVKNADKRVEAAQKAYDAEVEARNNGYANNVATAKKELEQEKKKRREQQKILEQAQKRQQAIDTVTQTSSLITASAGLWQSFSKMGPAGPGLALAAIATMWASFAAAKIRARQVTAPVSDEYGEGGLEFLEGGSHASGNDINLGVKNKRKRNMKAEGGEALAIINKKRTRKYKNILPDVISSLNKGTFEEKYINAFSSSDGLNISINSNNSIDLSKLEDDISAIRKQSEIQYYTLPNGSIVIQHKNVKRIIKN